MSAAEPRVAAVAQALCTYGPVARALGMGGGVFGCVPKVGTYILQICIEMILGLAA